jgi:hypothetical protein
MYFPPGRGVRGEDRLSLGKSSMRKGGRGEDRLSLGKSSMRKGGQGGKTV